MYCTIDEAREALWQRRRDLVLRRRIQEYLGEMPGFIRQGPRAILTRQIASPTLEFRQFVHQAQEARLPATALEYLGDRFCSSNPDKLALGKMIFHQGFGRNHGRRTSQRTVIDLSAWDGTPLDRIVTREGEGFIDFHHRLLKSRYPDVEISDTTDWLRRMGGRPQYFWPRLMSLFVCDGILFENFHTEGHEAGFNRRIIQPAIAEVEKRFGHSPLIVAVVPVEQERDRQWSWYPEDLEALVRAAKQGPLPMPASQVSH